MTRDDYIKLHRQTVEAIELVETYGIHRCVVESSDSGFDDNWYGVGDGLAPMWNCPFYRAHLKPQPKLVPWSSLDEVPLTHWFRHNGTLRLLRVESIDVVSTVAPVMICDRIVTMRELLELYEHAAPCDKHSDLIWLPCGKEVVE